MSPQNVVALELSLEDRERVIQGALQAKESAYSPYSKFRVGAALLTPSGEIIQGCNVENASYGGTICAERTALVKAISEGKKTFVALAVTSDVAAHISPCGICRQFIREFCALSMPIYLAPSDHPASRKSEEEDKNVKADGVLETTLGELLPYSFGPEQLKLPRKS